MKSFLKIFFASLLALIIFTVMGFFLLIGIVSLASSEDKSSIDARAILVLDLSQQFPEQSKDDPFAAFMNKSENEIPSLYDVVRMIRAAKTDTLVKGIYIQCAENANGFAASEELRKALLDFKTSRKFIYAYGETISQKAYYVASVSDFIACHPQGGLEFSGMVTSLFFVKGMLEKLEIQPQIFYAGKFKSATEPFREYKMTDANRLQTNIWLGDLNQHMLAAVSASRRIDTADLSRMAMSGLIQSAYDAKKYKLLDDLLYDDQLKAKLNQQVALGAQDKANYVTFGEYAKAADFRQTGSDRIAVIYADGDISGGNETDEQIGSDAYRNLIRKLRLDNSVKAIVLRVNSPGGSALASDVIWREISLTREKKPVIVSMGDVAASGGYYISCNADSVFTNENTITGSIGVFSIVPNLEKFFQNKLGVGFDRVKTAPFADMGSVDRSLTDVEKRFFQNSVDSIYTTFKSRVAAGRKMKIDAVDSIAQGRVWTGSRAISVGLADRIGTLQDAINCAARMSKLGSYSIREYPEKKTLLEEFTQGYKKSIQSSVMKDNFSSEATYWFSQWKGIQQMVGTPQMKMPFRFEIR